MRLRGLLVALLPLLSACLDAPTLPAEATIEGTTFASSLGVDLAASTKVNGALYYRDVTVGDGATFTVGQRVGVHYVGYLSTGAAFDSLKAPDEPLAFTLGGGQLIPGFEAGVLGMKVGGTRQIIIGPALAYGRNDAKDSAGNVVIPGNSVLVFNVEAVSAQ